MAILTKKTKPKADYHTWYASELTNGDIIDLWESLGFRDADSVTIESLNGPSVIRFNVVKKIHKEHGELHNSWVGLGAGSPQQRAPLLVGEVEDTSKDDITVEQDSVQTWLRIEAKIRDIKIVTKSTGLKITVT